MLIGTGSTERYLSLEQLAEIVEQAATAIPVAGKRILIIIPDGTRTMPMPAMFALFEKLFRPQAKALDYLVALGTHPLMTDAQLTTLVGVPVADGQAGAAHIFNHHWENPGTFVRLATN